MADTEEAVTDETAAAGGGDLDERVGKLETGQDTIAEKVDRILGILGKDKNAAHDAAQDHTEAKLDRPTNIADEIRQQLDERDRLAAEERDKSDLASLKETVKALTEKAPEPMPRRIEKIMWGDR